MHGLNPRTLLGETWWDGVRKRAYYKYDYRCWACGADGAANPVRQLLEAHETYRIDYRRGRMVFVEAVALCYFCHAFIHLGRTAMLADEGKLSQAVYNKIVRHGQRILREAGLKRREAYQGPIAPWGKWRLVAEGQEYPPLYASEQIWASKYADQGD